MSGGCVCVRGARGEGLGGGVSEEGGWRRSAAGASSSSPPHYTHTHIPLPRYPLGYVGTVLAWSSATGAKSRV